MPTYPASKLRIAFEILRRSGRLDQVEKALAERNFMVEVSEADAKALADELNAALGDLEARDAAYFKQVIPETSGDARVTRRSPDCPC